MATQTEASRGHLSYFARLSQQSTLTVTLNLLLDLQQILTRSSPEPHRQPVLQLYLSVSLSLCLSVSLPLSLSLC